MAHARETVRDASVSLLSASPKHWGRVFNSRFTPSRDVLPYLLVYIDSESSAATDVTAGFILQRDMTLRVLGRNRILEGEDIENALDDMAQEIEETLTFSALNTKLSSTLKILELVGTTSSIVEDENERTFAEVALDWRVLVHTIEGAPSTLV